MFNKVYVKIKKIFKNNYKDIIFLSLFAFIVLYKLPYNICVSGGTTDVGDRIQIEGATTSEGSFGLAYVTELRATIPTFLLSYVIPSWDLYKISDYGIDENDTVEDIETRNKLDLLDSEQSATIVAYNYANKEMNVKESHMKIYYVYKQVTCDLKVGDNLLKIDNTNITAPSLINDVIKNKNFGDTVEVLVDRNNKEVKTTCEILNISDNKVVGVILYNIMEYDTNPKITINFHENETGPSGGLVLTLAIYDALVEEDITRGLTIVGTGTIDIDGTVGEIGGVKYKFTAAAKAKADVFIVPNGENYDEVMKIKEEKGYDIKVIGVDNFNDAVTKLKDLKVD